MKVLSIQQPWASLIIQGHKRIETRSWNTKYRGDILIHASLKKITVQLGMYPLFDHMSKTGFDKGYINLPYGALIGKVTLLETIKFDGNEKDKKQDFHNGKLFEYTEQELAFGDYSPGRYGWLLSDPVIFPEPIPAKGKLGLWEFYQL